MTHIHQVKDTDVHYKIDGITRTIVNVDETKRMLVQNDHNSERLTFEVPRYVDGHDLSECNVVQVHYINSDIYEKNHSSDIYEVDDLGIKGSSDEDKNVVVLSWLVHGNATKYVGTLNFVIRFSCVTDGYVDYAWNTTIYKGITILPGIYNSEQIAERYSDILSYHSGLLNTLGNSSGVTNVEKALILSLFRNAAYTADMSAVFAQLEALWSGSGEAPEEPDDPIEPEEPDIPDDPSVIMHTIIKKLDGVSINNSTTFVVDGASYACNLTAHDGYTLDGAEVSVAMGGMDITSTAYSNGVINIASVTGDVDITVVAREIQRYSVINNLTGVTNSNQQTEVSEGFYSANLSLESGYELNSITITMGGVDITADVYGEGNILITEVTGDIVITAVAGLPAPVYLLENKTFDGSAGQIIDTGIALFDTQKDWSIYIALTTADAATTNSKAACWHKSVESAYPNAVNVGRGQWNTNWFVRAVTVQYQVSDNLAKCAVIITHTKEENTHKYYGVVGGEIVTGDLPSRGVGTDGTLKIGGSYDYEETTEKELFIGTINTAEVHLRVLTEAEIKEKLGVA